MNKFQQVDFKDVQEMLDFLPEEELKITEILRELILSCAPECREKLSYNVPFYYLNSRFCFIWPGSVPWGKQKRSGVRLGFTRGQLLSDETQLLFREHLKEIAYVDFFSARDIPFDIVKSLIYEALDLDIAFARKNKH